MWKLFILTAFIVTLVSCEEYFVPNIDPKENVLVFDGLLTNEEGPHYIKISRSVPYNTDSEFENVSGFLVYVEDENGNINMFPEKEPGLYLSDALFKGIASNKYRMVARSNNKTYYSNYDELLPTAPIDTITGVYYEKEVLKYSEKLGYYEELEYGVKVLCSLNANNYAKHYRYEYEQVFQIRQTYPGVPSSTPEFDSKKFQWFGN